MTCCLRWLVLSVYCLSKWCSLNWIDTGQLKWKSSNIFCERIKKNKTFVLCFLSFYFWNKKHVPMLDMQPIFKNNCKLWRKKKKSIDLFSSCWALWELLGKLWNTCRNVSLNKHVWRMRHIPETAYFPASTIASFPSSQHITLTPTPSGLPLPHSFLPHMPVILFSFSSDSFFHLHCLQYLAFFFTLIV